MYDGIKLELASTPPDSPMLGDECLVADHYEGENVNENYTKVQEKLEEALRALNGYVHVIVNKENIVQDLISIYKDSTILEKKAVVGKEGAEASGDGLLREIYSLFWDSFLSQSDGDSEHSIPILPNLNQEDYVNVGRILTHQFVLCLEIFFLLQYVHRRLFFCSSYLTHRVNVLLRLRSRRIQETRAPVNRTD